MQVPQQHQGLLPVPHVLWAGQHQLVAHRALHALRVTPPLLAASHAPNAPLVALHCRRVSHVHSVVLVNMHWQVQLPVRRAREVILLLQAAMFVCHAHRAMPPRPEACVF